MLRNYGITMERYEELLLQQGGGCAICGAKPSGVAGREFLAIDHDHKSGQVRGLLCDLHNLALGMFKDRADHLRVAAQYLENR